MDDLQTTARQALALQPLVQPVARGPQGFHPHRTSIARLHHQPRWRRTQPLWMSIQYRKWTSLPLPHHPPLPSPDAWWTA